MPATSKQSLIVTGKPSRGRATPGATRASELAAARQADAALFLHNRVQGRIEALHGGKSRKIRRSSAENSRLSSAACILAAESSKCGMAGSLRMV